MKTLEIKTKIHSYAIEELDEDLRCLVEKAKESIKGSYSPYSHFQVGAAVLLNDGSVYTGANQENAAYPSGLCAERTAMFYANANAPHTPVKAIAVAGHTDGHFTHEPASPCGNCRQVLIETEHRFSQPMKVLLYGESGVLVFDSAKDLLPLSFVSDNLEG